MFLAVGVVGINPPVYDVRLESELEANATIAISLTMSDAMCIETTSIASLQSPLRVSGSQLTACQRSKNPSLKHSNFPMQAASEVHAGTRKPPVITARTER